MLLIRVCATVCTVTMPAGTVPSALVLTTARPSVWVGPCHLPESGQVLVSVVDIMSVMGRGWKGGVNARRTPNHHNECGQQHEGLVWITVSCTQTSQMPVTS